MRKVKIKICNPRNPFVFVAKFRNSGGPIGGDKRLRKKRDRQKSKKLLKNESGEGRVSETKESFSE